MSRTTQAGWTRWTRWLLVASAALLVGCGSGGGSSNGSSDSGLTVVSSTPNNGAGSVGLSLSSVSVRFNKAVATTYDAGSFSWPHLADVQAFLLLEDTTDAVPIQYFLDYDSANKALVFYLSDPPQADHAYQLTVIDGMTSEAGVQKTGDTVIHYTMGDATFGSGIFANAVSDYSPEIPGGSTLGQGRYIAASILGEPHGSLHTTSLGDDNSGEGGQITVTFGAGISGSGACIVDGTGDDFIVHENVFSFPDDNGTQNYTEAAFVEVSNDGTTFYRFANTFPSADPTKVGQANQFSGLAGINVGGDGFDLADVIATHSLPSDFAACFVKIIDAGATVPDYDSDGEFGVFDGSGADIDAIEVLHSEPSP